jgi:aspartate-semialdehyde dehydrogenase
VFALDPSVINDKMVPALRKILIINPNSTRGMTNALKPLVDSLGYSSVFITYKKQEHV